MTGDFQCFQNFARLASNGTDVIVCFSSTMCRSSIEAKIRKYLIDNNFIDYVIQLSSNLFFSIKKNKVSI